MNKTVDYYNQHAQGFIAQTLTADMSECQNRFLKHVKPGGKILDAGCGSGRDSLVFMREGFLVDAFDASEEICRIASEILGFSVECKQFENLAGSSEYDGIWACASLLHVNKDNLFSVMLKLKELLKPQGVLYASFKEGNIERVKDGRYFNDMTESACIDLVHRVGLEVVDVFRSEDVRKDHAGEFWINMIARRTYEAFAKPAVL